MINEKPKRNNNIFWYLRILAIVLSVVMPSLVYVLTDKQTILFAVVIPILPFILLAILSTPPKRLHVDKPFRKAGALLFANVGAVLILFSYTFFYLNRIEDYSGGGADIGMGLVMLTMPIALIIGVPLAALLGELVGDSVK